MSTVSSVGTPKKQTWSCTFPANIATETQSLLFVKKLFALSASSLFYQRGLLKENSFFDKKIDDVSVKVLRESPSCKETVKIINWLRICFDLLDKRALIKAVFIVYPRDGRMEEFLECYIFDFSYSNNQDVSMSFSTSGSFCSSFSSVSMNDIKDSTLKILQNLSSLVKQSLRPLKENLSLTMKLSFNEKLDKIPDGFKNVMSLNMTTIGVPKTLVVGAMETPFNSMEIHIQTGAELVEVGNMLEVTKKNKLIVENPVRCPCGLNVDDGLMVKCQTCNNWQHGICFAYKESTVPASHECEVCAKLNGHSTHLDLPEEKLRRKCQLRRCLLICSTAATVTQETLSLALGVDKNLAAKLIEDLKRKRIFTIMGEVDKERLNQEILPRLFCPSVRQMGDYSSPPAHKKRILSVCATTPLGIAEM